MRFLIAAISLALTTGAFAQTTPEPPPAAPQTAPVAGLDQVTQEHPEWFTEKNLVYKPCPASVVFYPERHHACLGCPTTCRWHQ
jgi:hypothetical protein